MVNLAKRIQTGQGPKDWRFCRVALTARGQIRPDLVIVNGKEERHHERVYYLEWRENGKRIRRPAGRDATDANNQRLAKEAELNATNNGVAVMPETGDSRALLRTLTALEQRIQQRLEPYATQLALDEIPGVDWTLAAVVIAELGVDMSVFGSEVLGGRQPMLKDLPALVYTDRVIKESMRLYPPAWSLAREVATEFEVEGYRIPVRANVVMSQWLLHHDSGYFKNATSFDPDRWGSDACQKLPRFAYFPFGGGPRQCIGAGFATMEAVLLLATIASRFKLRLVRGQEVIPVPSFTLRPKYGLRMTLERRADAVSVRSA